MVPKQEASGMGLRRSRKAAGVHTQFLSTVVMTAKRIASVIRVKSGCHQLGASLRIGLAT
jgi:hypothetical protein